MKLICKVEVSLNSAIHIATEIGRPAEVAEEPHFEYSNLPQLNGRMDEFDVHVKFKMGMIENPIVKGHQGWGGIGWTMTVTGDCDAIEEVVIHRSGSVYLGFVKAIWTSSNRIVDYFRYTMQNPFLRPMGLGNIISWKWFTGDGTEVAERDYTLMHHYAGFPDSPLSLGSRALRPDDLPDLQRALIDGSAISIEKDLKAQAQESIFEGKGLRAVLLLAVCCEVAIKTSFFHRDDVVSDIFDFLQEQRLMEATPLLLIDKVAKRAFGKSFKEENKVSYLAIEELFRCRNKVAHLARPTYRKIDNTRATPNAIALMEWWVAVDELLKWLNATAPVQKRPTPTAEEVEFSTRAWDAMLDARPAGNLNLGKAT